MMELSPGFYCKLILICKMIYLTTPKHSFLSMSSEAVVLFFLKVRLSHYLLCVDLQVNDTNEL